MVEEQLRTRGITNKKVLRAMSTVPREKFVPRKHKHLAYMDKPLPLDFGQTISQPYIVALICQTLALKGNEKVLDIGTGSGYQAAILSLLVKKVISMERIPQLAIRAKNILRKLSYKNIDVLVGDATHNLKPLPLFDAIISAAAAEKIPPIWKKQLKRNGKIILPLRKNFTQKLILLKKKGQCFVRKDIAHVLFVPLVSE